MIHGKQLAVSISTTGWRIQTPAQNERSQILLFGEGWNSMTKAMFWEAQRLRRRSTALSTRMCKVWGLIRAFNEIHVNFRAASAYHNLTEQTHTLKYISVDQRLASLFVQIIIDIGIYTCQNNTYLCSYYSCFQIPTTCPHDINFPFHTPPFHPSLSLRVAQHLGTRCPSHSSPVLQPWTQRRPHPCQFCTCPLSRKKVIRLSWSCHPCLGG